MSAKSTPQTQITVPKPMSLSQPGILQRSCDCGGVPGLAGECEECSSKRLSGQRNANSATPPNNPPDDQPTVQMQRSPVDGYSFSKLAIESQERLGIQTKLTIGQPNDKYEQEADRVADQVMQPSITSNPIIQPVQPSLPPNSQQLGNHLQQEAIEEENEENQDEEKKTQTKEQPGQIPKVTPGIETQLHRSQGKGENLPQATRIFMESRFGHTFSQVRVHTDRAAVQMNSALNARAFTQGHNIYFNANQYTPGSYEGKKLLAHELTHVVQQTGHQGTPITSLARRSPLIQRDPLHAEKGSPASVKENSDEVAPAAMTVSLSGIAITPVEGTVVLKEGNALRQGMAIVLKRLIGNQYQPGLEDEVIPKMPNGVIGSGQLAGEVTADKAGEPIGTITIRASLARDLVSYLESKNYQVALSQSQRELLALGVAGQEAWGLFNYKSIAEEVGVALPAWYSENLFLRELSQHAALLREFMEAASQFRANKNLETREALLQVLVKINEAIDFPTQVLEAIRTDEKLLDHPGYRLLWFPFKGEKAGETPKPEMAAADRPPTEFAGGLLRYLRTQDHLAGEALHKHNARKELLDRFIRFSLRSISPGGDEAISDQPGKANMPPLPAQLSVYPPLAPPLFVAADKTDYLYSMDLQFPDIYEALADAFGAFSYFWSYVRIPDEKIRQPGEVISVDDSNQDLNWQQPSVGDVAKGRFKRATRYGEADIKRAIDNIVNDIGAPGISALQLTAANAILRYIGTGIRFAIETINQKHYEKKILLPEEGLYIVRCSVAPEFSEGAEVVRAPSVAYMPVFVRPPESIAETQVNMAVEGRKEAWKRMMELQLLLFGSQPIPNRAELEQELTELKTTLLGSVGANLEYQKKLLQERLKNLPEGSLERKTIETQLETLQKILNVRQKRAAEHDLTSAEKLISAFVNDEGQTIQLTLEAVAKEASTPGKAKYYVSDLTTPDSRWAIAEADTRADALKNAVREILEEGGYGRGYCSLRIDGKTHTFRIEAGSAALMKEAIANVTTAISAAAVVAAPFTGGASLAILVPVGAIGATVSAYQLIDRARMNTLRFDLQMAMDVVTIVGSAAGLGGVAIAGRATSSMRLLTIGNRLAIVGIGADGLGVMLMGADLVDQISKVEGPPSLRAARIMELLGSAMVQAGIAVGTTLVHQAAQRKLAASEGWAGATGKVPGQEPVGSTRGKDVYEGLHPGMQPGAAKKKWLGESDMKKTTVPTIQKLLVDENYTLKPSNKQYKLTIERHPLPPVDVEVTFKFLTGDKLTPGAHGGESGKARHILERTVNAGGSSSWKATVEVDNALHPSSEAPFAIQHELREIDRIVRRFPDASPEVIKTQQQAGVYTPNSTATDPTAHDHAAAHELRDFYQELQTKEKEAGGIGNRDQWTASQKQEINWREARIQRQMAAMALHEPENLELKIKLLKEAFAAKGEMIPPRLLQQIREPHQRAAATAEHMKYQGSKPLAPTGQNVEISVEQMQKLMFPKDTELGLGDWKEKGLYGGHNTEGLKAFVTDNPHFAVVEVAQKTGAGTTFRKYEQYRWQGKGMPPTDKTHPMHPDFTGPIDQALWVKSNEPKTTADDLGLFLVSAEQAFQDWLKHEPNAATKREFGRGVTGKGVTAVANGVEFGGFYDHTPPDTWTIRTIFVEAQWF